MHLAMDGKVSGDIRFGGIRELSALYRGRNILTLEAIRSLLERVEDHEVKLNAWITVLRDEGIEEAKEIERDDRGDFTKPALLGIPVAL